MVLYDPTRAAVIAAAGRRGLELGEGEADQLIEIGQGLLRSCEALEAVAGHQLPTRFARRPGARPARQDNPHNAWAWRCEVQGADEGVLTGQRIAVKDIIPVAGMPMTAGSTPLKGYVADYDATVVDRVLGAGGTITGIATTEDMCLSGASVSAAGGQVRNPRDPVRSAGGSSSGVAALVASGAVDAGIGADQGGSIRIPSSLTGVLGLKPTYGLVPYTGCGPIDVSLDHLGPIAKAVPTMAALLQAIAGYDDGLDPRQRADVKAQDYLSVAHSQDVTGLRVGVVSEGFDRQGLSDPEVDQAVRTAIEGLAGLGAQVVPVQVPQHTLAMDMHGALLLQGAAHFMVGGHGTGQPGKGFYDERVGLVASGGMAARGDQLFASVKYAVAMGGYLWDTYGGAYYAKAQNLAVSLRKAYDAALAGVDLLAMPTTLVRAPRLPQSTVPGLDAVELALSPALISNTCAFNHTGHPAINVPVGAGDGLPFGMMIVGSWYGERTLLRAAAAIMNSPIAYRAQ